MNRIYVAIGVIALLLMVGCKGRQALPSHSTVSAEVENNFEALMVSYPEWETFSSKGEVGIELASGKSVNASTQVKMIRGEWLQISVRVILGIEVARIVITPDSVFVLNKVKRQIVAESLDEVSSRLSTPLSLATIQDALLGRVFLLDSDDNQYTINDFDVVEKAKSQWTLSPRRQDDRFTYRFELKGVQLLSAHAGATGDSKSVVCRYEDFVRQGDFVNFPSCMSLSLKGLSTPISLQLRYKSSSIVWNGRVKTDNLNLSKYSQVSMSQILKML